jgi:hypothetical protein
MTIQYITRKRPIQSTNSHEILCSIILSFIHATSAYNPIFVSIITIPLEFFIKS